MMFMPYYFFFFITLVMGSFMSISSMNWVYIWMGLEINLLSFIPLVVCSLGEMEAESSLKYFLVQALGSSLILLGGFSLMNYPNSMMTFYMSSFFLICSLMIKMGMFPFHFWLPHVMGGLSWFSCILLAVWQKFAPILIMGSILKLYSSWVLLLLGSFGSLIGGLGGMNQTQLRVLLAYSSIGHMGWMLISMISSFSILLYYFLIYSLITISIMSIMIFLSSKMVNLNIFSKFPLYISIFMSILFMSLGGLPPFLGFFPKWLVLMSGDFHNMYLCMFFLIFGSLMNIFYYLNIFFNIFLKSFISSFSSINMYMSFSISLIYSMFFIMSTLTLGMFYLI